MEKVVEMTGALVVAGVVINCVELSGKGVE